MRKLILAAAISLAFLPAAQSQVSIGISGPAVSIGINMPVYPQLVRIPGYPVYYYPRANANYFFYDGLYWVFLDDNWYASDWYDGPWRLVHPEYVPLYILRIPVRYYVHPPVWFRGWAYNAPPRWGEHWGGDWERRRSGWDHWDRRAAPAPAPLPHYQQQYRGERYPRSIERQETIRQDHYRFQPRDPVVREQFRSEPPRHERPNPQPNPQPYRQPEPRVQHAPPQAQPQPHAQPQPQPVQPQMQPPQPRMERAPHEQQPRGEGRRGGEGRGEGRGDDRDNRDNNNGHRQRQ